MTIPASFSGILFFALLLWPGFTYTTVRERRYPNRTPSAFRETVEIVGASLLIGLAVIVLVAASAFLFPGLTPQPHALLFHTNVYTEAHLRLVLVWLAIAVGVSQAIAGLLGINAFSQLAYKVLGREPATANTLHPSRMSAWWVAFTQYPVDEATPIVGCHLTDGSYVTGELHSFSRQYEDVTDRDLVLRPPLRFRPAGTTADESMGESRRSSRGRRPARPRTADRPDGP